MIESIFNAFKRRAETQLDSTAILDQDGNTVTFGELLEFVESNRSVLHQLGIGRRSRLGNLLPERSQTAVAHLLAVATCTSVPINPHATPDELDFIAHDMQLDALLTTESIFGTGVSNALTKKLTILTVSEIGSTPGLFRLTGNPATQPVDTGEPGPDDIATLLYTSGTTSRPKKVPQKQKNRVAHLDMFGKMLEIEPGQRCLNLMPMHHTTGLAAEFLCPLMFGASVAFADFNPATFEAIVNEVDPTWFNLVPSMHQMVQSALGGRTGVFQGSRLRFTRSSSARMPVGLRRQLESTYGVPLVDFYGATESGSMAFSSLSGTDYRTGSVGKATHDQVIIADLDGKQHPPGTTGEICVGGPTVIDGYEHNDEANEKAFRNGWYRTGDEGYFDVDGFLFITGRLSEVVNRGGEKFSLSEIDEALLGCENVVTGAAFTAQHPTLGSEIYAAVVLEPGANTTSAAIRSNLATHLSWAKVPKVIFLVDELPYNSTGRCKKTGSQSSSSAPVPAVLLTQAVPTAPGQAGATKRPLPPVQVRVPQSQQQAASQPGLAPSLSQPAMP